MTIFLILLLFATPTTATKDTYRETIDPQHYWYEEYYIPDDAIIPLIIDLRVTSGPALNIFILDQENFQLYQHDEDFFPHRGLSEMGVYMSDLEFTFMTAGNYFLAVDNYDYDQGSYPDQSTTFEMTSILGYDPDPPRPLQPGEIFIRPDEWFREGYEITQGIGNLRIMVDLVVEEGSPVNLYFVDPQNHQRAMIGEPFASHRGYQANEVYAFKETFEVSQSGDFFILIDNADRAGNLPMVGSIITFSSDAEANVAPALGWATILIGFAIVGFFTRKQISRNPG